VYNTTLDAQIRLLGEMSEELATASLTRTMPGWQRDDLAKDFQQLNAKLAPQKVAQKKREATPRPQRSKLTKDGAAVVDTESEAMTFIDVCAFALFGIIVVTVAIAIYGQL